MYSPLYDQPMSTRTLSKWFKDSQLSDYSLGWPGLKNCTYVRLLYILIFVLFAPSSVYYFLSSLLYFLMRLAIVNITSGSLSGGYKKYLFELVPKLYLSPLVSELVVFVPKSTSFPFPTDILCHVDYDSHLSPLKQILAGLNEFQPDIIFIPSARYFRFKSVPVVNMIRNMEPFQAPFGRNPLSEKLKNCLRFIVAYSSFLYSTRTIAVSQHVRDTICSLPFVSAKNVDIVYHGVDSTLDYSSTFIPSMLTLGSFLFTAGSIRPARGLETLIKSFKIILAHHPELI